MEVTECEGVAEMVPLEDGVDCGVTVRVRVVHPEVEAEGDT